MDTHTNIRAKSPINVDVQDKHSKDVVSFVSAEFLCNLSLATTNIVCMGSQKIK